MKTLITFLTLLLANSALASVTIYKTVPFNNVEMHQNDMIEASYDFGNNTKDQSAHAEIFCSDPSMTNVGKANWTYKNKVQTQNLPILLKISAEYTGAYADRVGTIVIKDTTDENPIYMSCNFFG
jgi:hypothetical protein